MRRPQNLLPEFAFISYVRRDGVTASYAPPGGGVGPYFDSYDVFLLQGTGREAIAGFTSGIASAIFS